MHLARLRHSTLKEEKVGVTKAIKGNLLRTVKACTHFLSNLINSSWDISVWIKVVERPNDQPINRAKILKYWYKLAKNIPPDTLLLHFQLKWRTATKHKRKMLICHNQTASLQARISFVSMFNHHKERNPLPGFYHNKSSSVQPYDMLKPEYKAKAFLGITVNDKLR